MKHFIKKVFLMAVIAVVCVFCAAAQNQKILPADDFFISANYDWITEAFKNHPEFRYYGLYSQQKASIQQAFVDILQNLKPETAEEEYVLNIYNSAFDFEQRNKAGIEPLRKFLELFEKAQSVEELIQADTVLFNETGLSVLINFTKSVHNEASYDISVLPPVLYFDIDEKKEKAIAEAYYSKLIKMIYGQKYNCKKYLKEFLEYENAIMELQYSDSFSETPYFTYVKNLFSGKYDFQKLYDDRNLAPVGFIGVGNSERLKARINLLFNSAPEQLKKHCQMGLLYKASVYLTEEMEYEYWKVDADLEGLDLPSREYIVQKDVIDFLKEDCYPVMENLYVRKYVTPEVVEDINRLVELERSAFINLIENSLNISEEEKSVLKGEIKGVGIQIGGNAHKLDYYQIIPSENPSLYFNNCSAAAVEFTAYYKKSNQLGYNHSDYCDNVYSDNSWNVSSGEILFLGGYLVPPMYSINFTIEQKLGAFGTVIGHEMSHVFSLVFTGSKNKDIREKAFNLYDGYEGFACGVTDGNKVLNEAIADIFGMEGSLQALKSVKEAPDYRQYFEAFANRHQKLLASYYERSLVKNDSHPLPRARVNCCVVNFPEFYEAFDIKPGDKMYVKPEDRVTLF